MILIGPTRRWNEKILKPMAEVIAADIEDLELPEDIEVYEVATVQPTPPPPPSLSDEITYVPMKKADPSVSASFTPTEPAILDASSSSSVVHNSRLTTHGNGSLIDSDSKGNSDGISGVQMEISDNLMITKVPMKAQIGSGNRDFAPPSRHEGKGGTRPRGCPCCDPDNMDNIIDNIMYGGGAFL